MPTSGPFFSINGSSCHFDSTIAISIAAVFEHQGFNENSWFSGEPSMFHSLLNTCSESPSARNVDKFISCHALPLLQISECGNPQDDFLHFLRITVYVGANGKFRDWFRQYFSLKYCRGGGRHPFVSQIKTWLKPFTQSIRDNRVPTPIFCSIKDVQGTCPEHGDVCK